MAIAKFNSSHKPLRGKVGGLVFKNYADKVVVTRAPTFSGEWSTAQQDGRKRFALASAYARNVCADPALRAKYEKIAARRGLTVRSVVISAYLQGKTAEIEMPPRRVRRPPLARTKPRRESFSVVSRSRFRMSLLRRRPLQESRNNEQQIRTKSYGPPLVVGRIVPSEHFASPTGITFRVSEDARAVTALLRRNDQEARSDVRGFCSPLSIPRMKPC